MILLLSTSDTDLLTAKAANEHPDVEFRWANPARLMLDDVDALLGGTPIPGSGGATGSQPDIIIVRLLGGRRAWEEGLNKLLTSGIPTIAVSGEQTMDAELTELSTAPSNVVTTAHRYLAEGGKNNLINLHNFLSDTLLLTGLGFDAPIHLPEWGILEGWEDNRTAGLQSEGESEARRIAVLYYRAQHLAGNTRYIDALCEAIADRGAVPVPIFTASLRQASDDLLQFLGTMDTLITTVLAAGGTKPATAQAGGDDGAWDVSALAELDLPVIQGLALTSSRSTWEDNDDGASPLDVATQIAVPEFDGRIITVPFSFKEIGDDGLISYNPDPERCARLAGIADRHAVLRHKANASKRIAVMLSAYPTKHARIGNAVGLDTPASVLALLHALHDAGYDLGDTSKIPGWLDSGDETSENSDAFMHALIDAGGQDPDWLTDEVMAANELRLSAADYQEYFDTLPESLQKDMIETWGEAPGDLYVQPETKDIYLSGLRFGNIVVMVQPPRGFGDNPVGIYHDPDLTPNHHYLAAYEWIRRTPDRHGFGADAIVHVGKHGNMEWLPGKTVALGPDSGTDQSIGDLPLIYPFLVNDPGEGTQAKRRAHATLVDHLIPPMARAESYGDITRLEQFLDEHANIAAMDPAKLPAIRQEIWTLLTAAKMDQDLGWEKRPDEDVFDDMLMHVDGWLCEIKDAQIRGGLHILSHAPEGKQLVETVLAMLRARQIFGGINTLPGLREALGLNEDGSETRHRTDDIENIASALVTALADHNWDDNTVNNVLEEIRRDPGLPDSADVAAVRDILHFTTTQIVPRLRQTSRELDQVLRALDGKFIESGPSGSPLRGLINTLPTGRNFYSVDPKAIPSRLAWDTGQLLADSLIERYKQDNDGKYPVSVGISAWGTSAMRTSGDDIAEVFALLGVRPIWDEVSRRVTRLEVIPLEELGRPRIDTTVRISGFFRDAFPHVVALLDDAVQMVAALDEPADMNFVATHVNEDTANGTPAERAHRRIFGSKPGTYGAGLLELMDAGNWRSDDDLAEVYSTWGGYAYGRGVDGAPAADDMKQAYTRIQVAAKNTDTREHDIADSDDYFQFHGGMVATVRALSGQSPEAYIGDSTRPDTIRTRTLHEESRRVFRSRVVNPRWVEAMRNHGYKGAFEMAATVDYLFGYDATAGMMDDWMYEQLTQEYVENEENREFFRESNPWALHDISERLLEAAQRGLWKNPDQDRLDALTEALLETEGEMEDR